MTPKLVLDAGKAERNDWIITGQDDDWQVEEGRREREVMGKLWRPIPPPPETGTMKDDPNPNIFLIGDSIAFSCPWSELTLWQKLRLIFLAPFYKVRSWLT